MQQTLAFPELPPPQPKPSVALDAEARAGALQNLARIIAQAIEGTKQMEETNE